MLSAIAALMFLLAFIVIPGPIARLLGAKFAAMFVAATGIFAVPVIFGPGWGSALTAGLDVALLLVGVKLASRFGFVREVCAIWTTRIAALISAFFFVAFSALALMVASLDGRAIDALPYDFLALVSAIVFAAVLWRRQERASIRSFAGNLVSAPAQA